VDYKLISEDKNNGHTKLQAPSKTPEDFEIDSHPIQETETLEDFELDSVSSAEDRESQRPKFTGWRGILLGVVIGIILAVGGTRLLSKPAATPKAQPTPAALPPQMSVTVAPVETTTVARTLEATGTVAASDLLPVLPQATGLQIKQVLAEEGNIVRAGQVMAILDNSVLQTQLSQAQAQLEAAKSNVQQKQAALGQAKAAVNQSKASVGQAQATLAQNRANLVQAQTTLKRYQQLAAQGAISSQELDTRTTTVATAAEAVRAAQANVSNAEAGINSALANVSSAQANVSSALAEVRSNEARVQQIRTQLGQTQVLAPASGIVAEKLARVGDTSGNQKLFTLIRNGVLELQAKIPETQLSEVRIGTQVTVTSKADSRIRLQGTVREIAPTVDQQSREATVKIDLPANPLLKPGMFLRAAITTDTAQGLTVPAKAVLPQPDGTTIIYLLEDQNTARRQTVEVGATTGGNSGDLSTARIEIKSGLKESDRVIVQGAGFLKDGDKVQVVSSQ